MDLKNKSIKNINRQKQKNKSFVIRNKYAPVRSRAQRDPATGCFRGVITPFFLTFCDHLAGAVTRSA